MKLLFDANLSPKLVGRLSDLFSGSTHVFDTDLVRDTPDLAIWKYAAANGYAIVTADSDFIGLSQEYGYPPKVIRIEKCTFRTAEVEALIRRNAIRIVEFETSEAAVLTLRLSS